LPFSSRLRTNTGIAKGRRSHFRSSRSALFWLKPATFPVALTPVYWHIMGQTQEPYVSLSITPCKTG
jgi:hypothetical protein